MEGINIIIRPMIPYPYVVTISSEKGGVGKTTLATNLAIFLKALHEDLPVSILSFDNHFTVDKMFEIKGHPPRGDVADFLQSVPGNELLHTGQYGVNYIPSSRSLSNLKHSLIGTLLLARFLARSRIPGILIIDTRPDLDILTQNALFAADRALIPVKDMASLENCRNIFDLFDKKGFDRKSLALIPCIIDSRIKFDGPFQDQRSLLRAFAINRGYRCLDTFISKSPKVETLSTNPSGRVLPIFSYARNTEVFGQFTQLARTVLEGFNATPSPRAQLFHEWLVKEDERNSESYSSRKESLREGCIFCDRPFSIDEPGAFSYYFESSDGAACGFLEDGCFTDLLLSTVFNLGENLTPDDPKRLMFKEATRGSSYVFRPAGNGSGKMLEFSRFTGDCVQVARKLYQLHEPGADHATRNRSGLATLYEQTLSGFNGEPRDAFILVHPVDPSRPDAILKEDNYREFTKFKRRITDQVGT
jgi:cellulose biosynthesis protein BcsQ